MDAGIELLPWTITIISTETFMLKKMAQHSKLLTNTNAQYFIIGFRLQSLFHTLK